MRGRVAGEVCQDPAVTWILDLDGVVWLGNTAIPGAVDAITALRRAGETVAFVTNFSASPIGELHAKLGRFGIDGRDDVITSAMAVATLVQPGERVLLCAGPGVREALEARHAVVVDDGPADSVVVGYHTTFDYQRMQVASTAVREGAQAAGHQRRRHVPERRRTAAGHGRDPGRDRAGERGQRGHRRQAVRADGEPDPRSLRARRDDGR